MKAIKYIAAIALLAGLLSCQQEFNQGMQTLPESEPEMVEVSFSVHFPEPIPVNTKSPMGEGPLVDGFSLGFCLYGAGNGFVQNWQKAELVSTTLDGDFITGGSFKVLLPLTDEQRIVHVIADIPADFDPSNPSAEDPITNEYMDDIMPKLVTTDKQGAYWQEIVLENGIRQHPEGTTYVPDDDLVAALSDIHLVRNYAKLTVTNYDPSDTEHYGGFVVKRWALINVPDMGLVAPYTGNSSKRFPTGYTNITAYTGVDALLEQLSGTEEGQDNYLGSIPSAATIDESFPGDPDDDAYASKYAIGGGSQYMYERPLPTTSQKQTAVLVEIEFDADNSVSVQYRADQGIEDPTVKAKYWYKIEVLNDKAQYVPFYRNIAYVLRIEGLESAGDITAEAAYNGTYFGNISASLETASLNELSDGSSTIYVDKMDYTFLSGETTITLMKDSETAAQYWFMPDVNNPDGKYTQSAEGICDVKVELLTGGSAATAINPNYEDGSIQVTLAEIGSGVKKSVIRVSGRIGDNTPTNTNKYIYREITINLMGIQSFIHTNDSVTEETAFDGTPSASGLNNPVKINIYLPEGLGASVFPIHVRIEAENNTLSATSQDLPVSTGKSVFDPNRNTYFFIRTIEYSEYCTLNPRTKQYEFTYKYPVTLYTSKSGTGDVNATRIDIRDMAEPGKFKSKLLTLGNPTVPSPDTYVPYPEEP